MLLHLHFLTQTPLQRETANIRLARFDCECRCISETLVNEARWWAKSLNRLLRGRLGHLPGSYTIPNELTAPTYISYYYCFSYLCFYCYCFSCVFHLLLLLLATSADDQEVTREDGRVIDVYQWRHSLSAIRCCLVHHAHTQPALPLSLPHLIAGSTATVSVSAVVAWLRGTLDTLLGRYCGSVLF